MEVAGAHSNTKDQVSALEALRQSLPELYAPPQPTPKRANPSRTWRLPDDQVQQLIEDYKSRLYRLRAG
ncbi:hypothetical protein GCM10027563_24900 [Parasphingorhabdus pacifica]